MKKALSIAMAVLAISGTAFAQSESKCRIYSGGIVHAFSPNGKWMVCETSTEGAMKIINLETNQSWNCVGSDVDRNQGYDLAFTSAVSDDGIVVAEVSGIPSYWIAGEDGKGHWTNLKGYMRDDNGMVFAMVGGITPDGSMIVGALGKGGGSMMSDDDFQMTYPCVWYRQEDGTYGAPEWLPCPARDIFNRIPQYVHAHAVSLDGKTIAGQMRSGSGYFHFPLAWTRNDNGQWEVKELGMNLVNPKNIEPYPFPGEFNDDLPAPNYEAYMTPEQLNAFYAYDPAARYQEAHPNATDDDIRVYELYTAAEFMNDDKKIEYLTQLDKWANRYNEWADAWAKYEDSMIKIMESGFDFEFNNVYISPDGKYYYSSAKAGMATNYTPVRIEIATNDNVLYANSHNIILTCVADDYTMLGYEYNADKDWYVMGYVFPQGSTDYVTFPEFMEENATEDILEWMEENMYRGLIVDVNDHVEDGWAVGQPVCTPDMSIFACSISQVYFETPVSNDMYISWIIPMQFRGDDPEYDAVESIASDDNAPVEYFNLQGVRVNNPDKGIYIMRQGNKTTKVVK